MGLHPGATTSEVMREVGARMQRYRLQRNLTLEELAEQAGVSLSTAARAEAGKNPTLATLVRLLRALDRLDALEAFLPAPLVSPIALAEQGGRERQRASRPRGPTDD